MTLTQKSAHRKDITTGKSSMEHRHFATVAAIINNMPSGRTELDVDRRTVARHFADELADTNPRFDRARFLRACGVEW